MTPSNFGQTLKKRARKTCQVNPILPFPLGDGRRRNEGGGGEHDEDKSAFSLLASFIFARSFSLRGGKRGRSVMSVWSPSASTASSSCSPATVISTAAANNPFPPAVPLRSDSLLLRRRRQLALTAEIGHFQEEKLHSRVIDEDEEGDDACSVSTVSGSGMNLFRKIVRKNCAQATAAAASDSSRPPDCNEASANEFRRAVLIGRLVGQEEESDGGKDAPLPAPSNRSSLTLSTISGSGVLFLRNYLRKKKAKNDFNCSAVPYPPQRDSVASTIADLLLSDLDEEESELMALDWNREEDVHVDEELVFEHFPAVKSPQECDFLALFPPPSLLLPPPHTLNGVQMGGPRSAFTRPQLLPAAKRAEVIEESAEESSSVATLIAEEGAAGDDESDEETERYSPYSFHADDEVEKAVEVDESGHSSPIGTSRLAEMLKHAIK